MHEIILRENLKQDSLKSLADAVFAETKLMIKAERLK